MAEDVSEEVLAALHTAVTLAKERQIQKVTSLLIVVIAQGFSEETARAAILLWANYETRKAA